MDNHHNHHSAGFSNGFVLGAIIGAGAVFLLGTKKGKSILKTLTENGIEGFAGLKDIMDEDFLEDEEEEVIDPQPYSNPKPIKRFFKGIKNKKELST